MSDYQDGKFTKLHEENLEAVKIEYINEFNKQLDKISGYYIFIIESILTNKQFSIEEEINKINNVTLNDIMEYSKGYIKKMDYIVIGSMGDEYE